MYSLLVEEVWRGAQQSPDLLVSFGIISAFCMFHFQLQHYTKVKSNQYVIIQDTLKQKLLLQISQKIIIRKLELELNVKTQ